MESAAEGNTVMVKLDDGENLIESLKGAARTRSVESGCVVFGIGQLRDFELGYFDGSTYQRRTFNEAHELVALHGTVTLNLDPPLHLHAAVSKDDFVLVGGHLFKATVATLGEICIQKFSTIKMGRELDKRTGLKKLTLR